VSSNSTLGNVVPREELRAGTDVLIVAETADELRGVPEFVLETAVDPGDGAVVVITEEPGRIIADRLAGLEGLTSERLGVVDCTPGDADAGRRRPLFHELASKTDLTGVSMALSDCRQALERRGVDRVHLLYDSLTPVVFGEDPDVAVRFVHHLMASAGSRDGTGVYPVYTNMTSGRDLERLKHLADALVEVRRRGDGREVRCRGFRTAPSGWTTLQPAGTDAVRSRSD
jgi:hypothetical protein